MDTDTGTTDTGNVDGDTDTQTFSQADIDRIVKDRLARERAKYADYEDMKAKASKLDELEEAQKSELERLKEALEREAQARTAAEQARRDSELRHTVIASAMTHNAVDPDAVLALLDKASLLDERGALGDVDGAVTKLLADKPYLVKQSAPPAPGLPSSIGATSTNGNDPSNLSMEEYMRQYHPNIAGLK